MNTYENGSRLEAKVGATVSKSKSPTCTGSPWRVVVQVDNWEQLYKLFKRKNIGGWGVSEVGTCGCLCCTSQLDSSAQDTMSGISKAEPWAQKFNERVHQLCPDLV